MIEKGVYFSVFHILVQTFVKCDKHENFNSLNLQDYLYLISSYLKKFRIVLSTLLTMKMIRKN